MEDRPSWHKRRFQNMILFVLQWLWTKAAEEEMIGRERDEKDKPEQKPLFKSMYLILINGFTYTFYFSFYVGVYGWTGVVIKNNGIDDAKN
jgi:hypothetical protein